MNFYNLKYKNVITIFLSLIAATPCNAGHSATLRTIFTAVYTMFYISTETFMFSLLKVSHFFQDRQDLMLKTEKKRIPRRIALPFTKGWQSFIFSVHIVITNSLSEETNLLLSETQEPKWSL